MYISDVQNPPPHTHTHKQTQINWDSSIIYLLFSNHNSSSISITEPRLDPVFLLFSPFQPTCPRPPHPPRNSCVFICQSCSNDGENLVTWQARTSQHPHATPIPQFPAPWSKGEAGIVTLCQACTYLHRWIRPNTTPRIKRNESLKKAPGYEM